MPSLNGDGSDCCSGFVDQYLGDCIPCTGTGEPSVNGDGSDCCSLAADWWGDCS
jgi:hypothetical protein